MVFPGFCVAGGDSKCRALFRFGGVVVAMRRVFSRRSGLGGAVGSVECAFGVPGSVGSLASVTQSS